MQQVNEMHPKSEPERRTSFVVGIAGGSGSGKSTLARRIIETLPEESVLLIAHDSYYRHRPDVSYEERCRINFDHPGALETDLLATHLAELKAGRPVEQPQYDFSLHLRREETVRLDPRPVIVVEGILILADENLCRLMDLKIFLEEEDATRLERRLRRDVRERGRTEESVLRQYEESVRPMYETFVAPSRARADIVVPPGASRVAYYPLLISFLEAVVNR